jgi:multicomponent Na+:H+ antiporter subunit A
MVLGGWRALSQTDLKLLLAYGTVSQLGFLMLLFGVGDPVTTFAGTAMLLAHTLFKAALFMVVGIVDHQAHTRDLRRLTGLGRRMPATVVVAALAAASMAGLPPLLGFVTKEAALEGLLEAAAPWAVAAVVVGSAFTVAYSARLLWGAFARKEGLIEPVGDEAAAPSGWFLAPAAVVAAAGLLWGVVPALADGWVGAAAESLAEHAGEHHLALWHGFTPALGLSAAAIAFGAVLHGRRGLVDGVASVTRRVPAAVSAYQWSLGALNRTADRVTGVVQPGSLPFYLAVILLAATLLPGWWLVKGIELPAEAVLAESPLQLLVALLVVAAAVGVASAPARLGAVLFLGAVGYGVAVLFVIQGAPDLALTQMLIETLTLAIFVLVLRYLPEHFDRVQWRVGRLLRMGVAGMLGTMVTLFALWSAGSRVSEGISAEFVQRSLPEGGGKNVVNVILTDFRALDTLGEITVLAVAALGVVALVRAPRPAAPDKEEG